MPCSFAMSCASMDCVAPVSGVHNSWNGVVQGPASHKTIFGVGWLSGPVVLTSTGSDDLTWTPSSCSI